MVAKNCERKSILRFFSRTCFLFFSYNTTKLIENVGFEILNVSENNLEEGGSITIYARKKNNKIEASNIDLYLEKRRKYLSTEAILKFAQKSMQTIQNVYKYVDEQRNKGKKIAVWELDSEDVRFWLCAN